MIEVKGIDGEVHQVVTYHTFRAWVMRVALAFVLLSVGVTVGVWALTKHSNKDIIQKINTFSMQSCLASTKPGSTINKYNDLVNDLIESRTKVLNINIQNNDIPAIKIDRLALDRYRNDKLAVPTKEQCNNPILKG